MAWCLVKHRDSLTVYLYIFKENRPVPSTSKAFKIAKNSGSAFSDMSTFLIPHSPILNPFPLQEISFQIKQAVPK
jgi:hypothetical protein